MLKKRKTASQTDRQTPDKVILKCRYASQTPLGDPGVRSRMCPPYPQRVVKGDLIGRFLGITVQKWWPRVGAWTGTLKNPTKCLWRLEPDRRSNFFFIPPAHICAVTYMTEISLNVTLNIRIHLNSRHKKKMPWV